MYGIIIAFKDYKFLKGILGSAWVGFENFQLMFSGRSFKQVFFNTLSISGLKFVFGFPFPILFAILLNELSNIKFKKAIQTISYLPHFLSWVVLAGMFIQFLSPSSGPINKLLILLNFKPIYFLGDSNWFRVVLVVTSIWKAVGWGSIIYLASLSNINPELYESAMIDGANRLKQIIHITLPGLAPVITITLILSVGQIMGDDFDQVFNLYSPAVYGVGDVISTYTYRMGLVSMKYSFATAVGLFQNIIALSLILITNMISKKINDYGIW